MHILNTVNNKWVEAEIIPATQKEMGSIKGKWNFNWKEIFQNDYSSKIFILKIKNNHGNMEGVLQLQTENAMLIMNVIEIAPHNIGRKKKYEHVAGCLIAFACRKSFELSGDYKGFLTFVSKSSLIELYQNKYGAKLAMGQRMYIDPDAGSILIDRYLDSKI